MGRIATLTVALAGWSLQTPTPPVQPGSLTVIVNGTRLFALNLPTDEQTQRPIEAGVLARIISNTFNFLRPALLHAGTNTISFRINDGSTTAVNNVQYDALRLEIQ